MLVSTGDLVTWLFYTESPGKWARWVADYHNGIRVSIVGDRFSRNPPYRWHDFSPLVIGKPGMIAFGLGDDRPALGYLRREFPSHWKWLWDEIDKEYDSYRAKLEQAAAGGPKQTCPERW